MEVEAGAPESVEGVGRSQNVVYTLPHTTDAAARFLRGPLERVDPAAGPVQLLVLTADADSAVALSEAVLGMTGLGGIELVPVTNAARASRVLAMRPALAIAGPPAEIAALVSKSRLKLETLRTVVFAWADLVLDETPAAAAAIETVMAEVPRDAARVLVARDTTPAVEDLIERYVRRARREAGSAPGSATDARIEYVTVSSTSRPVALRRLLDEIDPPSAAVFARPGRSYEEARHALRRLGYHDEGDPIRLISGEIPENTNTVIYYDAPGTSEEIERAVTAKAVRLIALTQPRDLPAVRRLSSQISPLNVTASTTKLRSSDEQVRAEIRAALATGIAAREIMALEPLLDEHDGVEIAAAALRLLEHERARSKALAAARPPAPAAGAATGGGDGSGKTSLFITIGTRDGVRAGDLVGAIAGETGLAGSIVGKIDIQESHSLVEVDSQHAEAVIAKLNGGQLRGRKLLVRADRPRPEGRDRAPRGDRPGRSEGGPRGARPGGRDRGDAPRGGGFRDRPSRGPSGSRGDSRPPRGDARPPRRPSPRDRS